MRLIGYLRVSTEEQGANGHGLNAQRDGITAWCQTHGHELVEVETDVVSGRRTNRMVGRARAINRLWLGEADGLIGWNLDRITRSLLDGVELVQRSYAERWVLLTVDGVDTSSEDNEFVAHIRAAFAQEERRRIAKRTREGLAAARARGVRLGRPPSTPGDVIARVVAERHQGKTLAAIAQSLNADAIPTAQGGRCWYVTTVRNLLRRAGT